MKVTPDQKQRLNNAYADDERFHSVFDDILEERLMELDPEWMQEMKDLYSASGCARWCA
jgi:ferritin-like protein